MSSSPFMDDYSSEDYSDHSDHGEDYSDHDDDYCFVPSAASPQQVEIQTPVSNEFRQNSITIDPVQEVVSESMYFDVLPELEEEGGGGGMEQSIYLAVESDFNLVEAQVETGAAAVVLEAETVVVEELAAGSDAKLEAQVESGLPASTGAETVAESGDVAEPESLETVEAGTDVEAVNRMIGEFAYEAVEFDSDLDAEDDAMEEPNSLHGEHEADAVGPEAETTVEGDAIGVSINQVLESDYDLEVNEADAGGMVEEAKDDAVEEGDAIVESIHQVVESDCDLVVNEADAGGMIEEAEDDVVEEGDAIVECIHQVVESDCDLEVNEADAGGVVEEAEDDAVEEGDAVVESDCDLEVNEADAGGMVEEAEDDVVEGDEVVESVHQVVESDCDLEVNEADAGGMVEEEEVLVAGEDNVVEEEDGMVEEEDDFVKGVEAQALIEGGAAVDESIDQPPESNVDLQAQEPGALAEPAVVSFEMTTFTAQEQDSDLAPEEPEDLIDEPSDSGEEESALNEEELDSGGEDIAMDPEDSNTDSFNSSDRTDEEREDVVVSYLDSSTTTRSIAWPAFLVPPSRALAWATLPVNHDTTTRAERPSLHWESFLGPCRSMLLLQECGNAVMSVIEGLLRELWRIRDDLRRVLGALFRKRETTKHA